MIGNPKMFRKAIKESNKMQRELTTKPKMREEKVKLAICPTCGSKGAFGLDGQFIHGWKPKTRDWEKRFDKLIRSFNKDMQEAGLMFSESGWQDTIEEFISKLLSQKEAEVKEEGFIKGIELCEEIVKEALQDKEMADEPDDPKIRAKWLLTEFDTYKSNSLSAKEVEVREEIEKLIKSMRGKQINLPNGSSWIHPVRERAIKDILHSLTPPKEER